ncbi:MAG: hypothetical protein ACKVQK_24340 [Burkholderiales bacterium]
MKTACNPLTKQAKKPATKKQETKKPAPHRGSKRTEEFLNAVMGLKLR